MEERFNLYKLIHKYARAEISRVLELSGATDFNIPFERMEFLMALTSLDAFLNDHADREEKYIHPLLKKCKSNLLEEVEKEHIILHKKQKTLVDQASELTGESSYQFYLDFALYQSSYVVHLNYEEREILAELHNNFKDDDLKEVNNQLLSTMPKAITFNIMKGMLPVINHTERCEIFLEMQKSMPESIFNNMCKLAQDSLSLVDGNRLFEKIGYLTKLQEV
jgi:hypothetical protein